MPKRACLWIEVDINKRPETCIRLLCVILRDNVGVADSFSAAIMVPEGETVYDFCWYPYMLASGAWTYAIWIHWSVTLSRSFEMLLYSARSEHTGLILGSRFLRVKVDQASYFKEWGCCFNSKVNGQVLPMCWHSTFFGGLKHQLVTISICLLDLFPHSSPWDQHFGMFRDSDIQCTTKCRRCYLLFCCINKRSSCAPLGCSNRRGVSISSVIHVPSQPNSLIQVLCSVTILCHTFVLCFICIWAHSLVSSDSV